MNLKWPILIKIFLSFILTLIITSCGGGGGTTPQVSFSTVKLFSDGAGVGLGENKSLNTQMVFISPGIVDVVAAANESAQTGITGIQSSSFGVSGNTATATIRSGTITSGGVTFNVTAYTDNGGEAEALLLEIPSVANLVLTSGTPFTGTPSGTYTYNGLHANARRLVGAVPELGSFNMSANFSTNTYTYNSTTASSSLTGSGVLDSSTGRFASSSMTLNAPLGTYTATQYGLFHGTNATSVSGVFHSNDTNPDYAGAFVGSQNVNACFQNSLDERLATFCVLNNLAGKVVTHQDGRSITELIKNIGLSPHIKDHRDQNLPTLFVTPLLTYSNNINGGNNSQNLIINDLEFIGDPKFLRKKGLLIGTRVGAYGREIDINGHYIKYNFSGDLSRSPKYNLTTKSNYISACLINHVNNWWYIDICSNKFEDNKELKSYRENNFSFSLSKFSLGPKNSYVKHSIKLNHLKVLTYRQNQIEIEIQAIFNKSNSIIYSSKFGKKNKNRLSLSDEHKIQFQTKLLNVNTKLFFTKRHSNGGALLGVNLVEDILTKGISIQVLDNIEIGLGQTSTYSPILSFNDRGTFFIVNFSPIIF